MTDESIEVEGRDNGFDRLVNFSDAVIAIAITLLALEIRLPAHEGELDADGLYHALLATAPKIYAYIVSFLMVGNFWYGHHKKFRHIRGFDSTLISINLVFLMAICFVPFACSVLAEYHNHIAFTFYSLNMVVVSLLSSGMWGYVLSRPQLLAPHTDAHVRRQSFIDPLVIAAVFTAAAAISFFDLQVAQLSWLFLIPVVMGKVGSRRRKSKLPPESKLTRDSKLPGSGNPG